MYLAEIKTGDEWKEAADASRKAYEVLIICPVCSTLYITSI